MFIHFCAHYHEQRVQHAEKNREAMDERANAGNRRPSCLAIH